MTTTPQTHNPDEGSVSGLIEAAGARHFSTLHVVQFFAYEHLRPDLAAVSKVFADAMLATLAKLSDGPELTVALRKLLEAKDAAVRQALLDAGLIQRT